MQSELNIQSKPFKPVQIAKKPKKHPALSGSYFSNHKTYKSVSYQQPLIWMPLETPGHNFEAHSYAQGPHARNYFDQTSYSELSVGNSVDEFICNGYKCPYLQETDYISDSSLLEFTDQLDREVMLPPVVEPAQEPRATYPPQDALGSFPPREANAAFPPRLQRMYKSHWQMNQRLKEEESTFVSTGEALLSALTPSK